MAKHFSQHLAQTFAEDPQERVNGAVNISREFLEVDSLAITLISPRDESLNMVAASGYTAEVAEALTGEWFDSTLHSCILQFGYTDTRTWDRTNFGETPIAHHVFRAASYRNGISLTLTDSRGETFGYLHSNTRDDYYSDQIKELLGQVRDHITDATWPLHEKLNSALTTREEEILRLLADGYTTPEMAAELFISPRTISTHVDHILRKTGSSNRVQAAIWAVRHGYGSEEASAAIEPALA